MYLFYELQSKFIAPITVCFFSSITTQKKLKSKSSTRSWKYSLAAKKFSRHRIFQKKSRLAWIAFYGKFTLKPLWFFIILIISFNSISSHQLNLIEQFNWLSKIRKKSSSKIEVFPRGDEFWQMPKFLRLRIFGYLIKSGLAMT